MRTKQTIWFSALVCLIFFSLPTSSWSQETSGLQFLEIGPNTSSYGMSEANTAASIGPSNLYGNPANMAFEKRSSIGVDYTLWFLETNISHAAGTFKKENHAFGVGIISNKVNDLQARTQPGPSQGDFSVSYLSVAGAYAHQLSDHIAIGVTGQFLNEQYWVHQASGYAFNFGLTSRWFNKRVRLAARVSNVGQMSELNHTATPLPTNARAGASANLVEFTTPGANDLPILIKIHADWVQPLRQVDEDQYDYITEDTDNSFFNIGTEIDVGDIAVLRAGYQTQKHDVRNVSLGAGFWIENILFNYSVVPFDSGYKSGHSIGIHYYFD